MSTANTNPAAGPGTLEFYRLRDEFTAVYNPVNSVEQMFVAQIAMSWLRLQRAQSAEHRYFTAHDVVEAIAAKPREYNAITRYVSDCERAWRHAVVHLERMQRQRLGTTVRVPQAGPVKSKPIPIPMPATANAAPAPLQPETSAVTRAG